MYLAAVAVGLDGIRTAEGALKEGKVSEEDARKVVESNKDAVGIWLDKQVRCPPLGIGIGRGRGERVADGRRSSARL